MVKELCEIEAPEEQDEVLQQFCFKYQLGKYDLEKAVVDGIKESSPGVTRLEMRKSTAWTR